MSLSEGDVHVVVAEPVPGTCKFLLPCETAYSIADDFSDVVMVSSANRDNGFEIYYQEFLEPHTRFIRWNVSETTTIILLKW